MASTERQPTDVAFGQIFESGGHERLPRETEWKADSGRVMNRTVYILGVGTVRS